MPNVPSVFELEVTAQFLVTPLDRAWTSVGTSPHHLLLEIMKLEEGGGGEVGGVGVGVES